MGVTSDANQTGIFQNFIETISKQFGSGNEIIEKGGYILGVTTVILWPMRFLRKCLVPH